MVFIITMVEQPERALAFHQTHKRPVCSVLEVVKLNLVFEIERVQEMVEIALVWKRVEQHSGLNLPYQKLFLEFYRMLQYQELHPLQRGIVQRLGE
jgi:hypothetical protein